MELGEIYFYTATILNWKNLLKPVKYKEIITNSLWFLVTQKKIMVYGFVIMPNHLHLIWKLTQLNGKELPHASFMKFTSYQLLADLKEFHPEVLPYFEVNLKTRKYQLWQRDPLPIHLYSPAVIFQKLDYIYNNPVQGKWLLAKSPLDYKYSYASFYKTGVDELRFLTHIGERL